MNRLSIFAHYDPHDIIDDYVVYYLKKIIAISSKVVFVTTSRIGENEQLNCYSQRLLGFCQFSGLIKSKKWIFSPFWIFK